MARDERAYVDAVQRRERGGHPACVAGDPAARRERPGVDSDEHGAESTDATAESFEHDPVWEASFVNLSQENNKCFVVSPIGMGGTPGHQRARNVLEYVITPAAEKVGLEAARADDLSQPGSIATQVIQQLISAKMVVADLTELNPNVFYELAVRDSFGLPVVLIAEEGTVLPFDVIQQRTIFFDSGDLGSAIPAQDRIAQALREALDDPSGGSPVTAAVDLSALRSGNPEERQVAELAEQVARLSQEVASLRRSGVAPTNDRARTSNAPIMSTVTYGISKAMLRKDLATLSDDQLSRVLAGEKGLLPDVVDDEILRLVVLEEMVARTPGRVQ
jgi:hypothetical protein